MNPFFGVVIAAFLLGERGFLVDAQKLATELVGDPIGANMFMLGAAWVPGWMRSMDSAASAFIKNETRLQKLSAKPSEIVRRQLRVTPYPHEDAGWIAREAGAELGEHDLPRAALGRELEHEGMGPAGAQPLHHAVIHGFAAGEELFGGFLGPALGLHGCENHVASLSVKSYGGGCQPLKTKANTRPRMASASVSGRPAALPSGLRRTFVATVKVSVSPLPKSMRRVS
mgnify:CR=1 FL=1